MAASQNHHLVISTNAAITEEFQELGLTPEAQPNALCLSGGGVRSAAVCLGVIQVLARHAVLKDFHYLSSVSGGGYIAGWLTRLIAAQTDPVDGVDLADVERALSHGSGQEAEAIRGLRRFSNYLTPNPGPFSLDAWTGIILWVRNTLINWLVFLPVFAAVATVPILYFAMACALAGIFADPLNGLSLQALHVVAITCLATAVFGTILYLPSHQHPDQIQGRSKSEFGLTGSDLAWRIVVPIVAWCFITPLVIGSRGRDAAATRESLAPFLGASAADACQGRDAAACTFNAWPSSSDWLGYLPATSFVACLTAYAVAFVVICFRFWSDETLLSRHTQPFRKGILAWIVSALASSALLAWGIWLAERYTLDVYWLVLAGPGWVSLAEILRTSLYVALRRDGLRGDSDREWLARLNATKFLVILATSLAGAMVILVGRLLSGSAGPFPALVLSGGLVSGPIAAYLGKSAWTAITRAAQGHSRIVSISLIIAVGIVAFGLALLACVGHGVAYLVGSVAVWVSGPTPSFGSIAGLTCGLGVSSACLAMILGHVINLNHFSMHAVYRNRLIRAFLGSARPFAEGRPDRFTGFDPLDNIRMADTFGARKPRRLMHVVNVALNRTSGKDTARAERKAESFTITPLRCGAARLRGASDASDDKSTWTGAYAKTRSYAGRERDTGAYDETQGISLGTAIAISGAAASPNMGYHSSSPIAFVMTLFNVRLGAWLPNPALRRRSKLVRQRLMRLSGPRNEVPTLLNELLGRSDSDGDFLYLSDGGHFDNLGLYEMLRRRCRLIVAVDAGQDEDYGYSDLGRISQHALIDMGVRISFLKPIRTGEGTLPSQGGFAEICYPERVNDKHKLGYLIYIKSSLPADAPVELSACKTARKDFPHESTANQFFTESDFESYRRLGECLTESVIGRALQDPINKDRPLKNGEVELDRVADGLERIARSP